MPPPEADEDGDLGAEEDLYARVVRVGGESPITTKLEIVRLSGAFKVADRETARELAARLYETVKLRARVEWDTATLEIIDLTVEAVDTSWRDVHRAEVVREGGGILPLGLSV